MMIFSKERKALLIVLSTSLIMMFFNAAVVSSEMLVTTKDGRTHTLPVNSADVKKIEYTDGQSTAGQSTYGEYLGCFYDYKGGVRDLSGFSVSNGNMTTEQCVSTCKNKGFSYAGTQYSSQCYCGNSYGKFGNINNCNMKCAGNKDQICGGSHANSIYKTH